MSQIATTIEQSKRLLAAGIDPASADMCYKTLDVEPRESDDELMFDFITRPYSEYFKYVEPLGLSCRAIPAWSLSRLWDIIGGVLMFPHPSDSSDLISSLVAAIIYRANNGTLSKEYLK